MRGPDAALPADVQPVTAPDLGADADWRYALEEEEVVVIHTAARVHQMTDTATDPDVAWHLNARMLRFGWEREKRWGASREGKFGLLEAAVSNALTATG